MKVIARICLILSLLSINPAFAGMEFIYKEVTATAEGNDKEVAQWLAYLKAQHKVALQLPAVIRMKAITSDNQTSAEISKVLAQFVDSELIHSDIKDRTGWRESQYRYEVTSRYRFKIIPAAMIERAKYLEANKQLRHQISEMRMLAHDPEKLMTLRTDPTLPLSLLAEKMSDSPLILAQKAAEMELDQKILGANLDAKRLLEISEEAEDAYLKWSKVVVSQDLVDAEIETYHARVQEFVDLLPTYFANTIKVHEVEHELVELPHTFGWGLFLPEQEIKQLESKYGARPEVPAKPVEKLTITLDSDCDFKDEYEVKDLCYGWSTLPDPLKSYVKDNGLYTGDLHLSYDRLKEMITGKNKDKQPKGAVGNTSDWIYRLPAYDDKGGVMPGHVERARSYSVSNAIYTFAENQMLPELLGAGFIRTPRIVLSVHFPETKQYLNIPLSSDRYLLRPDNITVYLDIEGTTKQEILKRSRSARVLVRKEFDDQLERKAGYTEIKGSLHYANLPNQASDVGTHHILGRLVKWHLADPKWLPASVMGQPNYETAVAMLAACQSRGNMGRFNPMTNSFVEEGETGVIALPMPKPLYENCENHMILTYGKPPVMRTEGLRFVSSPINDPMKRIRDCRVKHIGIERDINCLDYYREYASLIHESVPDKGGKKNFQLWLIKLGLGSNEGVSRDKTERYQKQGGMPYQTYNGNNDLLDIR